MRISVLLNPYVNNSEQLRTMTIGFPCDILKKRHLKNIFLVTKRPFFDSWSMRGKFRKKSLTGCKRKNYVHLRKNNEQRYIRQMDSRFFRLFT